MKAVRVHRFGGPEVLTYEDAPDPSAPAAGQVLVDIKVVGINFSDTNYRRGLGPAAGMSMPLTPGHEAVGIVAAMGEGVSGFKIGDRVVFAGQHRLGTYKERMVLRAADLVPVPPDIDMKLAVAVLNQGRTAHYLVHDAHQTKPGQRVLIHAGAGGVGSNLVQMAKMLGAYVYATVSSDEKAEFVRRLGADKVILYTGVDFVEEIKKDTGGHGVDAVFDAVGGEVFAKSLGVLARRGHLVTYGTSDRRRAPVDWPPPGMTSGYLSHHGGADYNRAGGEGLARANEIFGWVREGRLKVHIHKEYALADARQAHRDLESRTTVGKLLLVP